MIWWNIFSVSIVTTNMAVSMESLTNSPEKDTFFIDVYVLRGGGMARAHQAQFYRELVWNSRQCRLKNGIVSVKRSDEAADRKRNRISLRRNVSMGIEKLSCREISDRTSGQFIAGPSVHFRNIEGMNGHLIDGPNRRKVPILASPRRRCPANGRQRNELSSIS